MSEVDENEAKEKALDLIRTLLRINNGGWTINGKSVHDALNLLLPELKKGEQK